LIQKETVEKRIAIETDLEKRLPPVLGDRVQLQQVIFNLLLNGIEAMETVTDRPKRLLIRSRLQNADAILIEIRDYGTGLTDAERIYEAFYTTKDKGMGMGLSICRSIVEAHGGRLGTAPSEGPGTTFVFTLPLESKASA
jgi:signal transduction histidine kinase